ncbi:MAG: DMT family transporter [Actinomycetota bacterium]|nr:DMT family transporter [Actinomycetota bacterium]
MTEARDRTLAGVGLGVVAAVAFGAVAVVAKLGYRTGAPVMPLLASRFAIAAVLLAIVRKVGRARAPEPRRRMHLIVLGALGYGFESSLFFAALSKTSAAVVGLVFYSYPLWTTLIALATGLERFRPRLMAALVLGSAGVITIFSLPHTALVGPLLALGAAIAVAVYFVIAQMLMTDVPAAAAANYTATGAALSVGVVSLGLHHWMPIAAVGYAFLLGAITVIAFLALYGAIVRIGSAHAAVAQMLEPVTTVLLAALVLDEALTARIGIGAALIVAALPIISIQRKQNAPPAADAM